MSIPRLYPRYAIVKVRPSIKKGRYSPFPLLVETAGIEPATSAVQGRRSPS